MRGLEDTMRLDDLMDNLLNVNPRSKPLLKSDVDAMVWRKLKLAKAGHTVPNYWEVLVSTKDARESGLNTIAAWCSRAVREAYARERVSEEGTTIACMLCSGLKIGMVKVSCERLDQDAKEVRVALVKASGAEIRGTSLKSFAIQLWDDKHVPIGQGISIGRDSSCDIVTNAIGVSRRHGQIVPDEDGGFMYVDRSRNGSTVDGTFIHHRRVPLRSGSYIGLVPGTFIQVQW